MTALSMHYAGIKKSKGARMPILTIRNVPDDVHDQLKTRAAANRRSLNSEAIECLRIALAGRSQRDVGGYLARARMVRERAAVYVTDDQIDRARREGRP